MKRFSDILRDRAATIWEQEHRHPFVVELGDGTLPLGKFQWYMKQDYLYLIDFSRVIALAVAKADTLEDMGTIAEVAATLLPCSWGYAEIGQVLEARGKPMEQPLYCRWIEMYSSPEFGELAEWLRSFTDRTALGLSDAQRERLVEIFVTNSKYEYLFWDAAYRMEEWPV